MLRKHLQFSNGHHNVAVRDDVGKHILIADTGVHTATIGKDEHGQLPFIAGDGIIHVHGTIDHEVRQRLLTDSDGLIGSTAAVFNYFHLFEAHSRIFVLQVPCKEGIHSGTGVLQCLVVGHAVWSMYFHIVHLCPCLLHFCHPVLCQLRFHDRVLSALQNKEGSLALSDVADGPPFSMLSPFSPTANLRGRCSTGCTGHVTCIFFPWVGGIVERLAIGSHTSHERQMSTG